MEERTRLAKSKTGYGYKYTELSQINEWLEQRGESYYQYTETFDGRDYIMTVKVKADGTESKPLRGCAILDSGVLSGGKANPAQQMGAATTYARRYSLLMVYGLATEDDDAECCTKQNQKTQQRLQQSRQPQGTIEINSPTAADIQALAAQTADVSPNPNRERVIRKFKEGNANWQKQHLANWGVSKIEDATDAQIDSFENYLKSKNIAY